MLDAVNPLGFISDLYKQGKLQKWYTLGVSCTLVAFVGFWGAFGLTGGAMLAAGHSPLTSLASALCSGALLMAGSVLATLKTQGAWKELKLTLPKGLQSIVESSDIGEPSGESIREGVPGF